MSKSEDSTTSLGNISMRIVFIYNSFTKLYQSKNGNSGKLPKKKKKKEKDYEIPDYLHWI